MSFTNRDPYGVPQVSEALLNSAVRLNAHVVHVICRHDAEYMSFLAITPFKPSIGEVIGLENGARCRVSWVSFTTSRTSPDRDGNSFPFLQVNVLAEYLENQAPDSH